MRYRFLIGLACVLVLVTSGTGCGTESAPAAPPDKTADKTSANGEASRGETQPGTTTSSPARPGPGTFGPGTFGPGTSGPGTSGTGSKPRATGKPEPQRPAPLVVLDPGHNGGNAAAPEQINKQVPAGRDRVKACNTTGTSTDAGYPEHKFNWDVAQRVRDTLTAHGVRVVLTRHSDDGVGPCVNRRAAIGNRPDVAAVVSIHADGAGSAHARGFHVAYSAPPLNAAQGTPATRLASTLRDGMRAAGLRSSTYIGTDGLSARDDLAGLNLSERPAVLVECGNMRNPAEAAAFSNPSGRQRYAEAIGTGILAFLG